MGEEMNGHPMLTSYNRKTSSRPRFVSSPSGLIWVMTLTCLVKQRWNQLLSTFMSSKLQSVVKIGTRNPNKPQLCVSESVSVCFCMCDPTQSDVWPPTNTVKLPSSSSPPPPRIPLLSRPLSVITLTDIFILTIKCSSKRVFLQPHKNQASR